MCAPVVRLDDTQLVVHLGDGTTDTLPHYLWDMEMFPAVDLGDDAANAAVAAMVAMFLAGDSGWRKVVHTKMHPALNTAVARLVGVFEEEEYLRNE